jgi:hypothetical protein
MSCCLMYREFGRYLRTRSGRSPWVTHDEQRGDPSNICKCIGLDLFYLIRYKPSPYASAASPEKKGRDTGRTEPELTAGVRPEVRNRQRAGAGEDALKHGSRKPN